MAPPWRLRRPPTDEPGEDPECGRTTAPEPAPAVPAARWPGAVDDGVGLLAAELPEAPSGDVDADVDGDEEGEAPGKFGVFANGVVTGGVLMTGAETLGVVAEGVVTDGVLTVGVGPTGVVTRGVVSEGTVTDGAVTDGTVTCGTVTAGVLTVGNPTWGSVAAVPASGWLISRPTVTAAPANHEVFRMPLKRSLGSKLAVSCANCPKEAASDAGAHNSSSTRA
jgi:hypothetical protein